MSIVDLIGNTPIIRLNSIDDESAAILAKLENLNSTGSHKERVAISLLEDAEKNNMIKPGSTTIVEPSDGNMGIALSVFCKLKGYDLIVVMPEFVSEERTQIIKAYGSNVILTPTVDGILGAINKANELSESNGNYYVLNQFNNKINLDIHYEETANEIIDQVDGSLDAFVCGYGTGGILSGIGLKLKEVYPKIIIIAVEPEESAVLSGKKPNLHEIYGIGPGFIPSNLNIEIIDEIQRVSFNDARESTKMLAKNYGLLVGISSGALYNVSHKVAKKLGKNKQMLTIFYDTGERYLSTGLFV